VLPQRYPLTINADTWEVGIAGEPAVVLEQLTPDLAEIVPTAGGLMTILRSLSPAERVDLIEALGPSLVDCIGSAGALRDLLAMASEGKDAQPAARGDDRLLTT